MTDLDQAEPGTAGLLAPPPLIYAGPLALGLLLQWWQPLWLLPPDLAAPLGITVLLLGLIGVPAILAFRRANTSFKPWTPTTALVTTGPYRFTRNPMYLGLTLLYLGTTFWANAAWPVIFLPLVIAVMHYGVIIREEAHLTQLFGEEYQAYRHRVRRWF